MTADEEPDASDHNLIISQGDCEFYGECSCGVPFNPPIRPNQSLDIFGARWDRHVNSPAGRVPVGGRP